MLVVSIPRLAEFGQFSKMASEKNEKVLLKKSSHLGFAGCTGHPNQVESS
jgi:hypothetical protein